jgi:hypothetical protein
MMRILVFLLNMLLTVAVFSQNIPEGHILQYQQDFSEKGPVSDFRSDDFQFWTIRTADRNKYLEYNHDMKIDSSVGSPLNICMVDNFIFGDFIFEVSLMHPGDSAGCEFSVLFGMKDSLNYYGVNFTSAGKDQNIGIFVVEKGQKVEIPGTRNKSIRWNPGRWQKIRVERDIVDTSVKVFIDDQNEPYLETKDRTFIMGYTGFGSNSGRVRIDNIKIWSQTSIPEPAHFLKKYSGKI